MRRTFAIGVTPALGTPNTIDGLVPPNARTYTAIQSVSTDAFATPRQRHSATILASRVSTKNRDDRNLGHRPFRPDGGSSGHAFGWFVAISDKWLRT